MDMQTYGTQWHMLGVLSRIKCGLTILYICSSRLIAIIMFKNSAYFYPTLISEKSTYFYDKVVFLKSHVLYRSKRVRDPVAMSTAIFLAAVSLDGASIHS